MTPEELSAIAKAAFPVTGWQRRLAEYLKVQNSTVWRWANGKVAIPHPVALAVRSLEKKT